MWILFLNDMRSAQVENVQPRLCAETKEILVAYVDSQMEPWRDGQWHKTYRKGSDLEWCNPPFDYDGPFRNIGTEAECAEQARVAFRELVRSVQKVGQ